MIKNTNTEKTLTQKILNIVGIILLTPIVLVILLVGFYFTTKPIFDNFDQDKFITLDKQMLSVYQSLNTASNGIDNWEYQTVCSPNMSGWMQTGTYNCIVSISTRKLITSVDELNNLQAKYYPVVDSSKNLKQKTELYLESPNDFGKNFVVSSAEKNYTEIKSGINCNYSILLYQSAKDRSFESDSYGSKIIDGKGDAIISIRCAETARSPWYQQGQNTSGLIPE
jgi:hypothetical protein